MSAGNMAPDGSKGKARRRKIGKTKRFAILSRDNFTCRYCGRRPPVVVLEIEHVNPFSVFGDESDANLVASCDDCNRGKGATVLEVAKTQSVTAEAADVAATAKAKRVENPGQSLARKRTPFASWMIRWCSELMVSNEVGPEGVLLLTLVAAHGGDAMLYKTDLCVLLRLPNEKALALLVKKCVEAKLVSFEPARGHYRLWCHTLPEDWGNV
jgi:hypothetical protein